MRLQRHTGVIGSVLSASRFYTFRRSMGLALTLVVCTVQTAHAIDRAPRRDASMDWHYTIAGVPTTRIVAPASLWRALAAVGGKIPSYSRSTGLACSACHYQFPHLTPFGRQFKLNGYTLTGLPTIGHPGDSAGKQSLKLSPISQLSAVIVSSVTQTNKALPGTQNATIALPDLFGVYVAGEITPKIGLFSQFTYSAAEGAFGFDHVDLRYADHHAVGARDLLYGITLNNNPTFQDVWNTGPAWRFPYISSSTAPSPIASPLIDDGLAGAVAGLGAYSLYAKTLYTEFSFYRAAPHGLAMPLDSTATNVAAGTIPYWRVALQHETPSTSLMVGTFGFGAQLYPTGVTGLQDHYSDVAVDAQVEQRNGTATWIGHASHIRERQHRFATQDAGGATNIDQTLATTRASLAYLPSLEYGYTLGYFQTTGTADPLLYTPDQVSGSRTGSPNTSGLIGEVDYNPWQNTRVGLQYVSYNSFNGSSTSYGMTGGRSASDNNTLYLFLWVLF
ncbi:MAG: cytochrome C [Gemmatimonadota bacterium]|nr:cytochrome C [Gemmatimonadota bacterium]